MVLFLRAAPQCRNKNSLELISTQPRSSTAARRSVSALRCLVAAASLGGGGSAAEGDEVELSGDRLG